MSYMYEITVWDIVNGDVVKYLSEASEEELEELRDWYDDGIHQVVVDREWEEEID